MEVDGHSAVEVSENACDFIYIIFFSVLDIVHRRSEKFVPFFFKEMQTYYLQCWSMAEELDAVVISIE